MVRLSEIAHAKELLHPNQCGSLTSLSSLDACLTLTRKVRILERPRLPASTPFLDIKAGLNNVNACTLRVLLLAKQTPSYLVHWVSSFLSEETCTLVFQVSHNLPAVVLVCTPQGSPIPPLLCLLYIATLHSAIPKGIMLYYVDDFAITVASDSHWGNIYRLQRVITDISQKGKDLGISLSVPKTALIPQQPPSRRTPHATSPIELEGHLFHPSRVVRWLGYWLTPALTSTPHFRHTLSLAQASFFFVKRVSSPGATVKPFPCHGIVNGLLLSLLTYRGDVFAPNSNALRSTNSF